MRGNNATPKLLLANAVAHGDYHQDLQAQTNAECPQSWSPILVVKPPFPDAASSSGASMEELLQPKR